VDKTIHGHDNLQTWQFADKMFHGHANSQTVDNSQKDVSWTCCLFSSRDR